jgi:hypothetical protein
MEMEPGISLRFKGLRREARLQCVDIEAGFDYVEVNAGLASRCRYYGQMVWIEEEKMVVAVFIDPDTRTFYGQGA